MVTYVVLVSASRVKLFHVVERNQVFVVALAHTHIRSDIDICTSTLVYIVMHRCTRT